MLEELNTMMTEKNNFVRYIKLHRNYTSKNEADEADYDFNEVTEPLVKCSVMIPVTRELYEDKSALEAYTKRAAVFLRLEQERYVARKLADDLPIYTAKPFHAVRREAFKMLENVYKKTQYWPDTILVAPKMLKKFGPKPWSTRVVAMPALNTGQMIVGNFQYGCLLVLGPEGELTATNSVSNFFQMNLIALMLERQTCLLIHTPNAFSMVQLRTWPTRLASFFGRKWRTLKWKLRSLRKHEEF